MQVLDGHTSLRFGGVGLPRLRSSLALTLGIGLLALVATSCAPEGAAPGEPPVETAASSVAGVDPLRSLERSALPSVRSVALRVHHTEAMLAFYRDAFGVTFREVDTFGIPSHFGTLSGMTLKLVPIRESADFEGYPDYQLGIEVSDLAAVLQVATRYGGRQEGELRSEDGLLHGAVRDPDGNTLELYQAVAP